MFLNQIESPTVKGNVCDYRQCIYCEEYFCSDDMSKHFILCMEAHEAKWRWEAEEERMVRYNEIYNQIYGKPKATPEPKSGKSKRRRVMFAIFTLLIGLVAGVVGMNHADNHHKNDNQQQEQKK